MLTEGLYKTGIWCHQRDKITDSDETVMLLMLLTGKKQQQEFFPLLSSQSKQRLKSEESACGREGNRRMVIFCSMSCEFSRCIFLQEVGLFSLEAGIACNFREQHT